MDTKNGLIKTDTLMLAGAIAHSPTAIFIGFLSVIAYLLASAKFVAWTLEADVDRHLNDKIVRKILGKSLPPANRNW